MVDKDNPDLIDLHIGESVYIQPKDVFHIKNREIFLVNRFAEIQHKLTNPYFVKLSFTPEYMQLDLSLMKHCRHLDYNIIDDDNIKLIQKNIEEQEVTEDEQELFELEPVKMIICEKIIENNSFLNTIMMNKTYGCFDSFCNFINENKMKPEIVVGNLFLEMGISFDDAY